MPTIDDFIRPKEWVSDFLSDLGKVLRKWGEERYVPIRQQVDEDWQEHKLIEPLLKEVEDYFLALLKAVAIWFKLQFPF